VADGLAGDIIHINPIPKKQTRLTWWTG